MNTNDTLTTTLTARDTFGNRESVTITWRPLSAEGVDLARDNINRTPQLWADRNHPPVSLRLSRVSHTISLVEDVARVDGVRSEVFEPVRTTAETLEPGQYRVDSYGCEGQKLDPETDLVVESGQSFR